MSEEKWFIANRITVTIQQKFYLQLIRNFLEATIVQQ